jgi:uncharacterized protein with HEPN domain
MTRGDDLRFHDILKAIESIQEYAAGLTRVQFVSNKLIQDAVIRNLEIIGEAAGSIDPEIRAEHEEIDWADITGMRHRLIHGYFDVDIELLWEIVRNDIPLLKSQIESIRDGEPRPEMGW